MDTGASEGIAAEGGVAGSFAAIGGSGGSTGGSGGQGVDATGDAMTGGLYGSGGGAGGAGPSATRPYLTPNPLISIHAPIEAPNCGDPKQLVDGVSYQKDWQCKPPFAIAINVAKDVKPNKILVNWSTETWAWDCLGNGAPGNYDILVSPDGVNYESRVSVTNNVHGRRAHSVDFTGMAWVEISVTDTATDTECSHSKPDRVDFDQIEVFDISKGKQDTWIVVGGSGTYRAAFNKSPKLGPSFATLINKNHPAYTPAVMSAIGDFQGEAAQAVNQIDGWLAEASDFTYWILNYGTSDSHGNQRPTDVSFQANMTTLIRKVTAAGKVAVIPNPVWMDRALMDSTHNTDQEHDNFQLFNDAIVMMNGGMDPVGPDWYAAFMKNGALFEQDRQANPSWLCQPGNCESGGVGFDPNELGAAELNQVWALAMAGLYAKP